MTAWQQRIQARWAALAPREQRGLTLAAAALLVALAWMVLLAPALRTLGGVDKQNAKLNAELERMQAMQTRATMLQSKPEVVPQDTLKALQSATTVLGKGASLQVAGDHATVTVKQISAQSLAPWFTPVSAAGLSPSDVHLQRSPGANGAEPLWNGVLVFRLPAGANTAH
jgi:general secretion pathway protein M